MIWTIYKPKYIINLEKNYRFLEIIIKRSDFTISRLGDYGYWFSLININFLIIFKQDYQLAHIRKTKYRYLGLKY